MSALKATVTEQLNLLEHAYFVRVIVLLYNPPWYRVDL